VEESFFKEKDSRTVTYQTPRGEEPFEWEKRCFYKEDGEPMYCPGSGSSLVIPEGFYFALGDNRVVSEDSRVIGLIHEEDIIGVAKYRRKVLWFERLE
jgi:signal peptidase I